MKSLNRTLAAVALAIPLLSQAALVAGTPSDSGNPTPTPLFGTLINFDDQPTNTCMSSNQYAAQGVSSITNALGPALCYFPSTQSNPNYVGTGFDNNWNADFKFVFSDLQAAVGIGIAGPTTMLFELYSDADVLLESYVVNAPLNNYYYINRASNDARWLRIAGDFIAIDDLQFDTQTVRPTPEPMSLALVGTALAGLAYSRRRKA